MEPTIENILKQHSLKWIFVGGKGGVGKTTTSCSLAIQLCKVRKSVLLISTDPAHNLSDAFGQKFGRTPTAVNGFDNLFAMVFMEIDPSATFEELSSDFKNTFADQPETQDGIAAFKGIMNEIGTSIPGVDEAMGFAEIMKLVKSMEYSTVVFDTAPTGHTLRFLSFPSIMSKAFQKLSELQTRFGPMIQQMTGLLGLNGPSGTQFNPNMLFSKISELQAITEDVNSQFKDATKTTFICVCIAEFLSLYETERMVQELASFGIDTHNIVVNQLVPPTANGLIVYLVLDCEMCVARRKIQKKYLDQIFELYEDFHIITLPLLNKEVRGVAALSSFSEMLLSSPLHFDQ